MTKTSSGCTLVVKVTDSWMACHEFEPCTAEDPPCRGGRCTLNMKRLKRPPVEEVSLVTAPVQVQSISPLSSSGRVARFLGGQTGVALDRKLHVWASNLQRNRHQMLLLFSRRDVTALALSYGTFPLRKV
ncbi:hypothetical protein TNCV_4605892 [Trichonephila clavipes]|nr:hypothetical protein TNCV_4605892 [Trichonephila clavipes]